VGDVLKQAMEEQHLSIRALEKSISEKLGKDKRVSRNLIHEYIQGKRPPTYEAALALATVLNINSKELLTLTFFERQQKREEAERRRFLSFCKRNGINISVCR
jgi:transcriptional regulator with XRE-family HTH domain